MFLINGRGVLLNKLFFNKIMGINVKKDKIQENFVKNDIQICANSLKNILLKIAALGLCTYVLSTYGNSYSYVRSIFTMRKIVYTLWVLDRSVMRQSEKKIWGSLFR